jgi:hypothetical protein
MNLCVDSLGSRLPLGATHLAEYPVPMGKVDEGSEEFRMDDLLYYDDPH